MVNWKFSIKRIFSSISIRIQYIAAYTIREWANYKFKEAFFELSYQKSFLFAYRTIKISSDSREMRYL